jgi:hypothetical protein
MDGILEGGVPPKSCISVTVTVDKIVMALGEECTVGTVTGLTTTTTSKSPGNTRTTTRMTVTINDIMPQGIETMAEREVGNNIVNSGNVGIEMGDVAGEAGGMAVQSSNRGRREKERKRKYPARKPGPVDVSAKIASQQRRTRAEWDRKYLFNEAVKQRRAENKRKRCQSTKLEMVVDSAMCSNCIDTVMKRAEYDRTYNSKEHAKERNVDNKRNTRHSTKAAQQAADVDGVIKAMKKKRANKFRKYDYSKYLRENGAELLRGGRAEVDGDCCDNCC